jgi:hypothetical protein
MTQLELFTDQGMPIPARTWTPEAWARWKRGEYTAEEMAELRRRVKGTSKRAASERKAVAIVATANLFGDE